MSTASTGGSGRARDPGGAILIVDHADEDRATVRGFLGGGRASVEEASSAIDGIDLARASPFDCVLVAVSMPAADDVDLLASLVESRGADAFGIVMLVSPESLAAGLAALERGAHGSPDKSRPSRAAGLGAGDGAVEKARLARERHANDDLARTMFESSPDCVKMLD